MDSERRRPRLENSWEWLEFAAGLPAEIIPFTGLSSNSLIAKGRFIVTGFTTSNGNAGAQTFNLHDGEDANGRLIAAFTAAASAKQVQAIPVRGVLAEIGIFAEISGGPISGSVFAVPLWHYPWTAPGT